MAVSHQSVQVKDMANREKILLFANAECNDAGEFVLVPSLREVDVAEPKCCESAAAYASIDPLTDSESTWF